MIDTQGGALHEFAVHYRARCGAGLSDIDAAFRYGLLALQGVQGRRRAGDRPRYAAQAERSFLNQFETPLLFFVLIAFLAITRIWDPLFVVLAWVWVATRIAHAIVHCTSNALSLRFPTFIAGVVVLVVMWARFAIELLA